jgi:indoleacetamide hydrolase
MSTVSRRRVLQMAASMVPLGFRGDFGNDEELLGLGAREAVMRMRRGELAVETYIARLVAHYNRHKNLNLANAIDPPRLLETARLADRMRARGAKLGPAFGLPFAVKDQLAVAGYPSTGGSGALRQHVPKRSAAAVDRLVRAGAIPFAMTSLPDMNVVDGLMHQLSSHSEPFGAVRNPYDPARIPGGSSGGNGAMLAARIVPAALGLDTNGSIRCPAAFCGVVGLRPSTFTIQNAIDGSNRKRYPDDGLVLPPARRLDTVGPMARTVTDVAFLDSLITGERVPTVNLRSVRIAVPHPSFWGEDWVDPDVAAIIRQALTTLRNAGCTLIEIDFNKQVRSIVGTIEQPTPAAVFAAEGMNAPLPSRDTMAAWLAQHAPDVTVEQMYRGRPIRDGKRTLPSRGEQIAALRDAAERYAEVYRAHRVSAIAYPTMPMIAPPIRAAGPKEPLGEVMSVNGRQIEEGRLAARNIFIAPRLGAAALTIPAGLARGLPVGLEFDALPGTDAALLGLGIAVQETIGLISPPVL